MNYLKRSLNILLLIGIIVSIAYFLRFDIYEHDDFNQSFFYTTNLWDIIIGADHGRYFSWIYMKLAVHGSAWLQNIHPNDDIIPKIITGINIAILTLIISQFSTKPFNKKASPIMILITFLVLLIIYTISLTNIYRYNQHFAYQSNLIIFFFVWGIIASYFINNTVPESRHLIRNSLFTLILGLSAHFNILSSIRSNRIFGDLWYCFFWCGRKMAF